MLGKYHKRNEWIWEFGCCRKSELKLERYRKPYALNSEQFLLNFTNNTCIWTYKHDRMYTQEAIEQDMCLQKTNDHKKATAPTTTARCERYVWITVFYVLVTWRRMRLCWNFALAVKRQGKIQNTRKKEQQHRRTNERQIRELYVLTTRFRFWTWIFPKTHKKESLQTNGSQKKASAN